MQNKTWRFWVRIGIVVIAAGLCFIPMGKTERSLEARLIMFLVMTASGLFFTIPVTQIIGWRNPDAAVYGSGPKILKPIMMGDYKTGLWEMDNLLRQLPRWQARKMAAWVYLLAGKTREAEGYIREVLAELQSFPERKQQKLKGEIAICQGLLGQILVAGERYNEAKMAFAEAINLGPEKSFFHDGLAKVLLLQGNALAEAQQQLEIAATFCDYEKQADPEHLALQAWVAACQGDPQTANTLLEKALIETKDKSITVQAQFIGYRGHILRALGQIDAARQAFEQALATDSHGLQGILAQRELDRF